MQVPGEAALKLCIEEDDQKVLVHLEDRSLCSTPVEGAAECYDELMYVWNAENLAERAARLGSTWRWWKSTKKKYEMTKCWKLIESFPKAIPDDKLATALAGILCATRRDINCFEFASFSKDDSVQVTRMTPSVRNSVFTVVQRWGAV